MEKSANFFHSKYDNFEILHILKGETTPLASAKRKNIYRRRRFDITTKLFDESATVVPTSGKYAGGISCDTEIRYTGK